MNDGVELKMKKSNLKKLKTISCSIALLAGIYGCTEKNNSIVENQVQSKIYKTESQSSSINTPPETDSKTPSTPEELEKRIIFIQHQIPPRGTNSQSRSGELLENEYSVKKNNLTEIMKNTEMSGVCNYDLGLIIDFSKELDSDRKFFQLKCKNSESKKKGLQQYYLNLTQESASTIGKIYNGDKIHFKGITDWCEIFFQSNPEHSNRLDYSCTINDVNAKILK
jgi:hypothetical protein